MGILDKFKRKKEDNEPPQQELLGENSEAPAGMPFQKHLIPSIPDKIGVTNEELLSDSLPPSYTPKGPSGKLPEMIYHAPYKA